MPSGTSDQTLAVQFQVFCLLVSHVPHLIKSLLVVTTMSNIKGLGEDGHLVSATLLEKIDKLREKNVGQYIPLPQV